MDLDDNPTRLVHRAEGEGNKNLWVLVLVAGLWIVSIAFYLPGMP